MSATAPSSFGQRLLNRLQAQGMESKDLAAALGVSENTVSSWITGQYRPRHERAERLAVALGMTMDELHGRTTAAPAAVTLPPGTTPRPAPAPPGPPSAPDDAEVLVRRVAALDVSAALEDLSRATPALMEVLDAVRRHVSGAGSG